MYNYIKFLTLIVLINFIVLGYYRIVVRKVMTAEINNVYIKTLTDEDVEKIKEKYENSCGIANLEGSIIISNPEDFRFITYTIIVTNNSNDKKVNVLNV